MTILVGPTVPAVSSAPVFHQIRCGPSPASIGTQEGPQTILRGVFFSPHKQWTANLWSHWSFNRRSWMQKRMTIKSISPTRKVLFCEWKWRERWGVLKVPSPVPLCRNRKSSIANYTFTSIWN